MPPLWRLRNKSDAPAVTHDGRLVQPGEIVDVPPHIVKLTIRQDPSTWERVE
jgi:hypothetical protein